MDELTKELRVVEVISASDAMTNARIDLEEAAANGGISEQRWEGIRRYVFPLLESERERLDQEYRRLQAQRF